MAASITLLPNGRWRARYRDKDGHWHQTTVDRKSDGERWARAEQTDQDRGMWFDSTGGKITLADFAATWRELASIVDSFGSLVNFAPTERSRIAPIPSPASCTSAVPADALSTDIRYVVVIGEEARTR